MYGEKLKKRSAKDLTNDAYAMFMCFFFCFFFILFKKAYNAIQIGTHNICIYDVGMHLNCIDVDAVEMGTHNICLYKTVDKKYTGCNLKTTKLLDCALIGYVR